ncbi:hypothetical protein BDR22DRAFT_883200 [Usnea florida]
MNSLGASGEENPFLVNGANALTFCLMVVSCSFSSVVVRFIAALCGISAGVFWMAEAAIALSFPEPYNQGRFLGLWLSFRVGGQILGGAINLGVNAQNGKAGKVSYKVHLAFIALQALGPLAGLLVNKLSKVQRKGGVRVNMSIMNGSLREMQLTANLFLGNNFLLIVPLIGQGVHTEADTFTYESLWFSVRARALGSFLLEILAIVAGSLLGAFLDRRNLALKACAMGSFFTVPGLQGTFRRVNPTAFALFSLWVAGLQLDYLNLYFVVGHIAKSPAEVIRVAGLLIGTESAWQNVSCGVNSVPIMASVGGLYLMGGLTDSRLACGGQDWDSFEDRGSDRGYRGNSPSPVNSLSHVEG